MLYYISKLYTYILNIEFLWIFLVLTLSLTLLYIFFISKKITCNDVCIYNKLVTYSAIILYMLIFIIYILIIRWFYLDAFFDIKKIPEYFIKVLMITNYKVLILQLLLLLNFIFLWITIFIKLHTLLKIQLLKFHMYYYNYAIYINAKNGIYSTGIGYIQVCKDKIPINEDSFLYNRLITKFYKDYSMVAFNHVCQRIVISLTVKVQKFLDNYNLNFFNFIPKSLVFLYKNSFVFLRYLSFILLITLFMYDCFFNNFLIIKVYYYLPFYIIFMFWYKLSFFLYNTNIMFNEILFERYYCYPEIAYIAITSKDEQSLQNYINNWCLDYTSPNQLEELFISNHPLFSKRYVKIPTGNPESPYVYMASDESHCIPYTVNNKI